MLSFLRCAIRGGKYPRWFPPRQGKRGTSRWIERLLIRVCPRKSAAKLAFCFFHAFVQTVLRRICPATAEQRLSRQTHGSAVTTGNRLSSFRSSSFRSSSFRGSSLLDPSLLDSCFLCVPLCP